MSGWMTPAGGACPGLVWMQGATPCYDSLKIDIGSVFHQLAVDFAGRGKVGSWCGGSDAYIFVVDQDEVRIDVWSARRAGVWSSSVTIDLYVGNPGGPGSGNFEVYPTQNVGAKVTKSYLSDGTGCGTVIKRTVTVNDDGTFSVT